MLIKSLQKFDSEKFTTSYEWTLINLISENTSVLSTNENCAY